jgi:hypothetical protein
MKKKAVIVIMTAFVFSRSPKCGEREIKILDAQVGLLRAI